MSHQAPRVSSRRTVPDLDRAISRGLADKNYSAAACVASVQGGIFHRNCYGLLNPTVPSSKLDHQALFDLGDLTKPLATGLAAMWLQAHHRLDLSLPVARILKDFSQAPFTHVTLDMLLDHSSGLPAQAPLYTTVQAADAKRRPDERLLGSRKSEPALRQALSSVAFAAEPGKKTIYSDLGFMLLGWVLEALIGKSLHTFLEAEIYRPIGIADEMFFVPLDAQRRQKPNKRLFVATQVCPLRQNLIQGQVYDGNAWALGGVAGHAGLFGSAQAVWRISQKLLECYRGQDNFFHPGTLKRFWTRSQRVDTTRTLGWDTPTVLHSSAGKRLSRTAVGHDSMTGPSLWVDHTHQTVGVLCTNATPAHPETWIATQAKIRGRIFELIAANAALGPPPPDTEEAWERLVQDKPKA